ncbi:MAG: NAD(P)-dependent glycerol-1-phosphate dehydrogenase [Candidatus Altiarchaeota archaeon]
MKDIELPRKVLVGHGVLKKTGGLIKSLHLRGRSYVICDRITREVAGNSVASQTHSEIVEETTAEGIKERIHKSAKYLIAVGGGTVIDAVKIAAYDAGIPYISIPTAASHDGIASPRASVKKDKPMSFMTNSPLGIVADTLIIANAPERLLSAGCADAISNYTAVLDWQLAKKEKNEYYGDYAAALSMLSAEIVMDNADKVKENVSIVVEALISSGVAIGIAGSSRPCSGSEHQFSHSLDIICEKPALHGEQCGVGTIMMAYLHKADWKRVRRSLEKVGAPVNARQLGIDDSTIIEALTKAHNVRDRYTILRDGLSERRAENLAKKTGVI